MRTELALALLVVTSCTRSVEDKPMVESPPPPPHVDAPAPDPRLFPDEEMGALVDRLSEKPGDFPSENYVSNELSLVDVAATLREPKLRGRAYVGVGPEQSFTYLAMLDPRVAYIVDIRRGNLLEHMFFRACFEAAATRAEFLSALLARRADTKPDDGVDALVAAYRAAKADDALRDAALARTKALFDRLHIARSPADDKTLARVVGAFAKHGLTIAYTMTGSQRRYPSLGEMLALRDDSGAPATFLASEDAYARVRRLEVENRVIPVVGDFGGTHALRAVAEDMKSRGLVLGAFYTSNVEQYLFDQHHYGELVTSVAAMPRDDESRIVRVWFDQGRRHPAQRPKLRTTQLTVRANAFLERAEKRPWTSYWDVVNEKPSSAAAP